MQRQYRLRSRKVLRYSRRMWRTRQKKFRRRIRQWKNQLRTEKNRIEILNPRKDAESVRRGDITETVREEMTEIMTAVTETVAHRETEEIITAEETTEITIEMIARRETEEIITAEEMIEMIVRADSITETDREETEMTVSRTTITARRIIILQFLHRLWKDRSHSRERIRARKTSRRRITARMTKTECLREESRRMIRSSRCRSHSRRNRR